MDQDVVLVQFVDITHADEATALSFLEATHWNLEEAVNTYLAGGFSEGRAGRARPAAPEIVPEEETQVRAPIPSTQGRLIDDDYYHYPRRMPVHTPVPAVVDAFRDFQYEAQLAQQPPLSEAALHRAPRKQEAQTIDDLFKPPIHLMFKRSFAEARQMAMEKKRWIVVNIQDEKEFASHTLNRDLWNDPQVRDFVNAHCIFLQFPHSHHEGEKVVQFYKPPSLPAILIIDPRTGQCVDTLIRPHLDKDDFTEKLNYVVASTSLDDLAAPPPKKYRHVEDMTEEEQMMAAIAASLGGADTTTSPLPQEPSRGRSRTSSESRGEGFSKGHTAHEQPPSSGSSKVAETKQPPPQQVDPAALEEKRRKLLAGLPTEPEASVKSAIRLAIRLPSGTRLQRRFNSTERFQAVLDYVEGSSDITIGDYDIVTTYPRKTYSDPTASLSDLGLHPQAMLFLELKNK